MSARRENRGARISRHGNRIESDSTSNPLRLLNEVGRVLDQDGVSWAAIALAVAYHGFVRASLDADAIVSMDSGLFERVLTDELEGLPMRIVSPEDLVSLKVFAGSPQDMADAASVVEIQGEALDRNLVCALCKGFGPEEEKRARALFASRPGP